MLPTERETVFGYRVVGLPLVTLVVIDEYCARLWSIHQVDSMYLLLSLEDYDRLWEVIRISYRLDAEWREKQVQEIRLVHLINQVTGSPIDVFPSSQLEQGAVLFGVYHPPLTHTPGADPSF